MDSIISSYCPCVSWFNVTVILVARGCVAQWLNKLSHLTEWCNRLQSALDISVRLFPFRTTKIGHIMTLYWHLEIFVQGLKIMMFSYHKKMT